MRIPRTVLLTAIFSLPIVLLAAPEPKATTEANPVGGVRQLEEFGPTTKGLEAQATYAKALEEMKKKGGILVIKGSTFKLLKELPLQTLERKPAAPAETKQWKTGNGVTVIVTDELSTEVQVPPLSGLRLERHLRLNDGDSLPHWGTHPMLTLENEVTYGSTSYLDWIQAPVEKGLDRRFYVATIRGLHPGMFVNIHGGLGYGGGVTRACIKSLGYDAEKKLHYVVADTSIDHKAGAIMHNKSNTGLVHMTQTSNNDNQTYDVKVIRNQYAHGDTYIYYCDFNYMSNVHSAAGDENGNCYAAFIRSKEDRFKGVIEAIDWAKAQVVFKSGGAQNVQTLGDSRPLINLNPKKQLTAGNVLIVPPTCYHEATDDGTCTFEGKSYPSKLVPNEITGVKGELKMGGLIRGSKDCGWTPDVVGRFFTVNTPEEKTPKGTLRWYEITKFTQNPDGTKDIEIRRFWWGAKSAGSPTLYSPDSYSKDGKLNPLAYIIAPGTYVNDVSRALPGGDRGGQRTLGVAPYRDQGTEFDFAAGDAVEQAIGPDPFKPQAFRCWTWEDVPGAFPSTLFDLRSYGAASRYSAMTIGGGPLTAADAEQRKQKKPAWDNFLVFDTAATVGLNFKGDLTDAAIKFKQPGKEAAIKWAYQSGVDQPAKEASLTVSRDSGELTFQGGGVRTRGPVAEVAGLSGDKIQASNLRGKNLAVENKVTTYRVKFPKPETDGEYAVFVEQNWLTNRAIGEKTAEGFTVTFSTPAPENAKLDWMIVR